MKFSWCFALFQNKWPHWATQVSQNKCNLWKENCSYFYICICHNQRSFEASYLWMSYIKCKQTITFRNFIMCINSISMILSNPHKESYEVTILCILILQMWKMRHGEDAQMTQCFHNVVVFPPTQMFKPICLIPTFTLLNMITVLQKGVKISKFQFSRQLKHF